MDNHELFSIFIALREMQGWELKDDGVWIAPEWMQEAEKNRREAEKNRREAMGRR